jgi:signal transduction histidine kinase
VSERLIASGERDMLLQEMIALSEAPGLEIGALVDERGIILADSTSTLNGQSALLTQLSRAVKLIGPSGQPALQLNDTADTIFSAYPFRTAAGRIGWVLLQFDRKEAVAAARADALVESRWMASAMAFLSFILWALLHFGFAARLGRLADGVRAFGEGGTDESMLPQGEDEVGKVSDAFVSMAARLRERDARQLRLEREILEISESERRRIGHDLHDGIGQKLTAASMAANAAAAALRKDAPEQAGRIAEIGQQLREAIAETRALSHGLAPVSLAEDGLAIALGALAESTARSGNVRCVFEQPEPVRVADEAVAGHLYRIAQEAVTNALKHASASEIRIGLERQGANLLLEVEDDGEGIDEKPDGDGGIGLRVMRYRAKLIGGELEIGSAPAGGGRIACRVKLPG